MRKLFLFISTIIFVVSCTKEVPETEKKLTKAVNEAEISKIIQDFQSSINSNDINAAINFLTEDFSSFVPDCDTAIDLYTFKNNLTLFKKQYPNGLIKIDIEEIFVSEELASVQTFTSYMNRDPVEEKMNPVYSERSIKLLRKQKLGSWKFFRMLSTTAYSYDE